MDDVSVALGIAAQTYFEELHKEEDPTSSDAQAKSFKKLPEIFQNAVDVETDLQLTFVVFDAVRTLVSSTETTDTDKVDRLSKESKSSRPPASRRRKQRSS